MKVLSIITIILVFDSCSQKGVYYRITNHDYDKIILYESHNFIRVTKFYSEIDTFWGMWKIYGDTLHLEIDTPNVFFNKNYLSTVEESHIKDELDSIYFESYYNNGNPAPFVIIKMNENENNIYSNEVGKIKIKKNRILKFEVGSTFTLANIKYKVKDTSSNHFIIRLHYITNSNGQFKAIEPTTQFILRKRKMFPISKYHYIYKKKNKKLKKQGYIWKLREKFKLSPR